MSSPAVGRLLDRLEEYGVECRIRQMIVTGTNAQALLLERLRQAGIVDVVAVEPATGGLAATAGIARRDDGSCVFVKTFGDLSSEGVFVAEADGLTALNELGGMPTAQVLLANEQLLALSMLGIRPASETFWTEFAHLLAHLHTSTVHPRFGWYEDNWLGRRRQINTWNDDGFAFFAEIRLLRWLGEPRIDVALGAEGRAALERLCERLSSCYPRNPPVSPTATCGLTTYWRLLTDTPR